MAENDALTGKLGNLNALMLDNDFINSACIFFSSGFPWPIPDPSLANWLGYEFDNYL